MRKDIDKKENQTRKETYSRKSREIAEVDKIISIRIAMGNGLMYEVEPDAPIFIMEIETTQDLVVSRSLALSGYYRHANSSLRSWFELTFDGIYFNDHPRKYSQWLDDRRKSPTFQKRWLEALFNKGLFRKFEKKYSLSQETWKLYEELSKFIHARGIERMGVFKPSRLWGMRGFNEIDFDRWFLNLKKVFEITSTILVLKYPKCFTSLPDFGESTSNFLGLLSKKRTSQWKNVGII